MNSEFVGTFKAFKGEDLVAEENVLLEVTEVSGQNVEIGFYAPLPGRPRMYLVVSLPELLSQVMDAGE